MGHKSTGTGRKHQGFAAMSPERRAEIASKGGKAAHAQGKAHEFTTEEARAAGLVGGKIISADREHMAEIGLKGARAKAKKHAAEDED